jgi:tetratricopeptide (TPR) repeat protein
VVLVAAPVAADNLTDARAHYEKANGAFALGKFADAAREYEAAFELRPDPALLYNAAQAHRIAGNKQRALLLYENDLRVYGSRISNRAEVQRHIEELRAAIEVEQRAATSPPTTPVPLGGTSGSAKPEPARPEPAPEPVKPEPARPEPARPEPARPEPAPPETAKPDASKSTVVLVAQPPKPLYKRPWLWGTVAAVAVVAAVGIAVGVTVGSAPPSPTLGHLTGN